MVRLRHRYIVGQIDIEGDWKAGALTRENGLMEALKKSIRNLHGIQGLAVAKAGLLAKYVSPSTKIVFIRMRRSAYEMVTSSLPFVTRLDGKPISIRTLYTGATIRHCNIFLARFHRKELEEKYGSLKSDLQRKMFQAELARLQPLSVSIS